MAQQSTVSPRWSEPEQPTGGSWWRSRLTGSPLTAPDRAAGLEPIVFGPTRDACIRETKRQDRVWADIPLRTGNREEAVRRLRLVTGNEEIEPTWVPARGSDVESGDVVADGHKVVHVQRRTYTPFYNPTFKVTTPDGSEVMFYKSAQVRILDLDGTVVDRIHGTEADTR